MLLRCRKPKLQKPRETHKMGHIGPSVLALACDTSGHCVPFLLRFVPLWLTLPDIYMTTLQAQNVQRCSASMRTSLLSSSACKSYFAPNDEQMCGALHMNNCSQACITRGSNHACVHVCAYIYIYIHTYIHTYIRGHIYIYLYLPKGAEFLLVAQKAVSG